ncbi:PIG-L family deacetylase [Nocardia sp. 348MFTsu5.1]|uniref:PIG-L family deacetylase n=1 Tax=Nocardia sp. 348MFTsu5.1 TaxID=1172185 RepID=UPI00037AB6E2|nr:PIG-L family deacetylase [Nocardia sp. 348MFTsu5.1]
MPHPSLLCVHAHPDDEALWTGGVLARCAERGGRTAVITCTWAEGTSRGSEVAASLKLLKADPPLLLGYADRPFPESAPGQPAFCDAPFDQVVGEVVAHIRRFRPDTIATYDPLGVYGHPDHVRAHRVTVAAIGAAAFPQLYPEAGPPWRTRLLYLATMPHSATSVLWPAIRKAARPAGPLPGVPDEMVDTTIDVSTWLDIKWKALQAHRTEMDRGGALTMLEELPEKVRRQVIRNEWFLRMPLAADPLDALDFSGTPHSVDGRP